MNPKAFIFFGGELIGSKKKYKIAEAYIKLDVDYETPRKSELERVLRTSAEESIKEFRYENGFVIVISFQPGSLKSKVTIYGALLFQGIIFYGSIRQGITQIYDDVKALSSKIIEKSEQRDEFIDQAAIRTERRTGLIGKLTRVLTRLDSLQHNLDNIGNNQVEVELRELRQQLADIIAMLDAQEQTAILNSLPPDIRNDLPPAQPQNVAHYERLYALKQDDFNEMGN